MADLKLKSKGVPNMDTDENPRIFKCKACPKHKAVSQFKQLVAHMRAHHPKSQVGEDGWEFMCLACDKDDTDRTFNDITKLRKHVTNDHPTLYAPFRCSCCRFGTLYKIWLQNHKISVHGTLAHFRCDQCPTKFFTLQERDNHMAREHMMNNFDRQCRICNKVLHKTSLAQHMRKRHKVDHIDQSNDNPNLFKTKPHKPEGVMMTNDKNPLVYACSSCPDFKPTNFLQKIDAHYRYNHACNESSVQCGLCKDKFDAISKLKKHLKENHFTEFQHRRCELCNFGTDVMGKLRAHKMADHPEIPHYGCNECCAVYYTQEELTSHGKVNHKPVQNYTDECQFCFKKFSNTKNLSRHLRKVHGLGHRCDLCGVNFTHRSQLTDHMIVHQLNSEQGQDGDDYKDELNQLKDDGEYVECHFGCGFGTTVKGELYKHFALEHRGQKRFKCDLCGLACNNNTRLMDHHNSVHVGLRPYICDGCGMSFSRKSNMTKHQRKGACKGYPVDEEEAKMMAKFDNNSPHEDHFECDKCGKTFKYKQSFKQHIDRIHMGKKDHQCDECGQLFTQVHHLRRHRVKAHDQGAELMPHICHICENRFVSIAAWRSHMRKYHDMVVTAAAEDQQKKYVKIFLIRIYGVSFSVQKRRKASRETISIY
jgi:KRAB domain-containing zinc finger protein